VLNPIVISRVIAAVAERRKTTLTVVQIALRVWKLFFVHKTKNSPQMSLVFSSQLSAVLVAVAYQNVSHIPTDKREL